MLTNYMLNIIAGSVNNEADLFYNGFAKFITE